VSPFVLTLDTLPTSGNISAVLEPLEGARIAIQVNDLRVAENYQLGRYGE
jgi:hypothetical protein